MNSQYVTYSLLLNIPPTRMGVIIEGKEVTQSDFTFMLYSFGTDLELIRGDINDLGLPIVCFW